MLEQTSFCFDAAVNQMQEKSSPDSLSVQSNTAGKVLSDDELIAFLAVNRLAGVGPSRANAILTKFGSMSAFFSEHGYRTRELKLSSLAIEQAADFSQLGLASELGQACTKDLKWLERENHHILAITDQRYPQNLINIHNPPTILFVQGDPKALTQPQISMVGSRNATKTGLSIASDFAYALTETAISVTSGLALGIDAAAHQGALRSGLCPTIAVVGNGLDQVYPRRHQQLAADILGAGGLIVSEFGVGVAPHAQHFPRRNRIISALSMGVIVVEATIKSGSLITARYALEQGKDVFAVPGPIHAPQSRGCHELIRQGATLVETVDHILEEIPDHLFNPVVHSVDVQLSHSTSTSTSASPASNSTKLDKPNQSEKQKATPMTPPMPVDLNSDEQAIYAHLSGQPQPIDQLVMSSGMPVRKVTTLLTILEIKGLIKCEPGGYCV